MSSLTGGKTVGTFSTLAASDAVGLSTTAGQYTTVGSGVAATKLNVYGSHVGGTGIAQLTGDGTAGYVSVASAAAGEAGFLFKPAGALSGQLYSDGLGFRIKNRVFGVGDQLTLNNSGRLGFGSVGSNATAHIHLHAGSAVASGAPLKLSSGALTPTPEAGGEEFLSNDRFYTGTDGSRRRYAVNGNVIALQPFTVATLPTGAAGDTAYVSDAAAPLYGAALTGGGAVLTPVFRNATGWVSA